MPAAIASHILLYTQDRCFFFKEEEGMVVLSTTDMLSPINRDGPLMGTPNILNLYLISMTASSATRVAIILAPYVNVLTVACLFEPRYMTVLLIIIFQPLTDLLVNLSLA